MFDAPKIRFSAVSLNQPLAAFLVRSVLDVDFTQGGHDHVYEFVPDDEVCIGDDLQDWE